LGGLSAAISANGPGRAAGDLIVVKTQLPAVCSGFFGRVTLSPGWTKKENKILVNRRGKVYKFSSLKRDRAGRDLAVL
jgi:hypothetical protein